MVAGMAVSQRRATAYIVIDSERCKGCGLCIPVCPKNVIGWASHFNQKAYTPAQVIPERAARCTGCTVCALMCPDIAISVCRRCEAASQPAP